jgi:hypothetical protein
MQYERAMMHYNSTLRNVGLFTSISFAMSSSRYFLTKGSQLLSKFILIMSVIVLSVALRINILLIRDMNEYTNESKSELDKKKYKNWYDIQAIIGIILLVCVLLHMYKLINYK